MSKAYSNKALPPGTVLREWRLEQVLGVGGFGIVYKGRGIYFDELVAIKEYFPSSISERDEDSTVVPIDSNAEEVHALGLKKFVEEAKLLWNLSTPTRHPNIVSVRSLFEIHGTAYMVMDFEDGMSLSKLLKDGHRWNEASLTKMFKPIAEGLDRAHRVGVLHRDIKPPNILITDDQRPVLIDFGSARFESGEATSTSVTFHTPPYAAIEQYVRTYDQGPWTDIYALGVVLYQCITGDKPPEVLERMHAGLGKPLAHGNWPGYSKNFLAAVDAAMTVKPTERPQSIPVWLKMFEDGGAPVIAAPQEPDTPEIDEDATRVEAYMPDKAATAEAAAADIVPVAPPEPGFSAPEDIQTAVPSDPEAVSFKRAGEDTQARKKEKPKAAPEQESKEAAEVPPPPEVEPAPEQDEPEQDESEAVPAEEPPPADEPEEAKESPAPVEEKPAKKATKPEKPSDQQAGDKKKLNPLMIGGAAAALAIAAIGGVFVFGGGDDEAAIDESLIAEQAFEPIDIEAAGGIAQALQAFTEDAAEARAPAAALKILSDAAEQLTGMETQLSQMANDPARADGVPAQQERMSGIAQKAAADFANAILGDADATARRFAAQVPWADPRNARAAASQPADRQALARQVRTALSSIRTAATEAGEAEDLATAFTAAQATLARNNAYNTAMARARRANTSQAQETTASETTVEEAAPTPAATPTATVSPGVSGQASSLWPQKARNFASIVREARGVADDVIALGRGSAPGDDASQDAKDSYRIRQANVQTARNYISYLDTLTNSMRGDRTEAEVDENISNAQETRRYLQQLLASSRAAQR